MLLSRQASSFANCMGRAVNSFRRPKSNNTLNAVLRRLGHAKDEIRVSGFRATASTLLNEMGRWNPDAIERQLALHDWLRSAA